MTNAVTSHPEYNRIAGQNKRAKTHGLNESVSIEEWEAVLDKYGRKCVVCGTTERLTMDHITPLSGGGHHVTDNLQPLCHRCNSRKRTRTTAEVQPPVGDPVRGFTTNNKEINALLDELTEQTGLTKTTIVKQALIMFEYDAATVQLMKLRRKAAHTNQPQTPQEDAR